MYTHTQIYSKTGAGVAQSLQSPITDWTTGVPSPAETKDFSSSLCVQTSSETQPASYPMGTGDKARLGRNADHSPPSRAEVKNELQLYFSPPKQHHDGSGRVFINSSSLSVTNLSPNFDCQ
jgi:hypothetical protein